MVTEKQLANLHPQFKSGEDDWRTPEQKKEWAANANRASQEARRKKKKLKDAAKWLLAANSIATEEDIIKKLEELGLVDATNAEAMMVAALKKALKGDVEALKFVRDTAGEAPKNQVELTGDLDKPVATLDLRSLSTEELLRLVDETGADEAPPPQPEE